MPGDSGTAPDFLAKKNPHPRDSRIRFVEATHKYSFVSTRGDATTLVGRWVTSVTPTVHGRFEQFDPDKTITKYYQRWQNDEHPKYYGMEPEEIKESWLKAGEEASRLGTCLHETIERHLNGEDAQPSDEIVDEWEMYEEYRQSTTWEPYRTEFLLFDSASRVCGSIDALVQNADGSFTIVDWKRSGHDLSPSAAHFGRFGTGPYRNIPDTHFHKYSLQTSFYAVILEKRYGFRIRNCQLVQLHPNFDEHRVIECIDYRKVAIAVLRRRARTIKRLERLRSWVWAIAFVCALTRRRQEV